MRRARSVLVNAQDADLVQRRQLGDDQHQEHEQVEAEWLAPKVRAVAGQQEQDYLRGGQGYRFRDNTTSGAGAALMGVPWLRFLPWERHRCAGWASAFAAPAARRPLARASPCNACSKTASLTPCCSEVRAQAGGAPVAAKSRPHINAHL